MVCAEGKGGARSCRGRIASRGWRRAELEREPEFRRRGGARRAVEEACGDGVHEPVLPELRVDPGGGESFCASVPGRQRNRARGRRHTVAARLRQQLRSGEPWIPFLVMDGLVPERIRSEGITSGRGALGLGFRDIEAGNPVT